MAFSHFAYLNELTSGAPTNRNTNGDLNALLHWALTTKSNWVRQYNDGTNFHSGWQPAAGGPMIYAHHKSTDSGDAGLSIIRLAENMSSATSLTDPVPQTGQCANSNSNWLVSNGGNCRFHIVVWESGIIYASQFGQTTDQWDIGIACKCESRFASDPYAWFIGVRNSTDTSSSALTNAFGSPAPASSSAVLGYGYILRNVTGTIKSEQAHFDYPIGAVFGRSGIFSGYPPAAGGIGNSFDTGKLLVHGIASDTTTPGSETAARRLAIPHLFYVAHSSLNGKGEGDTFSIGSSTFVLLKSASSGGAGLLLQTSNDWTGYPSG